MPNLDNTIKTRLITVDVLKSVFVLGMIAIHVLNKYLSSKSVFPAWNYLHFVEVGFVFCSGYLFAKQQSKTCNQNSIQTALCRLKRLYYPYLVYVAVHLSLTYFLPEYFSGVNYVFNLHYFTSSVLLTGGVDLGWLTVLFIQLSLISPFLWKIVNKKKIGLVFFFTVFLLSLVLVFYRIDSIYSRISSWFFWSLITMFSFYVALIEDRIKQKTFFIAMIMTGLFSGLLHLILHLFLLRLNLPTILTLHKYPPDFFFLSYGMTFTAILYLIFSKATIKNKIVEGFVVFISSHSYELLFLHYLVLDFMFTSFSFLKIPTLYLLVTTLSLMFLLFFKQVKILLKSLLTNTIIRNKLDEH